MLAYIDAATGGMIVAAAAGGMAGLRVAAKALVTGRRSRRSSDEGTEAHEPPEATPTDSR